MKLTVWVVMLVWLFPTAGSAQQPKLETEKDDIHGIIKEVSANVRRVTIELSRTVEKTVSVESETRIIVNQRQGTIDDLKPGQSVHVILERDSSKAILIEVT